MCTLAIIANSFIRSLQCHPEIYILKGFLLVEVSLLLDMNKLLWSSSNDFEIEMFGKAPA